MSKFKVGQKVVCIKASQIIFKVGKNPSLKKGDVYTVLAININDCCGTQTLDVGLKSDCTWSVCICGRDKIKHDGIHWCSASRFAPLEETREKIRYVAVSESLREQAQEFIQELEKVS